MNRTGLAAETAQSFSDKTGVTLRTRRIGEMKITDVAVTRQAQRRFGKPAGRYITIESEPDAQMLPAVMKRALEQLLPPCGRILVAGLGNPDITYDSLGSHVVKRTSVRRSKRYSVCAIETDVTRRTGIDTARMVRAAAREIHADCIIAVDSLACRAPEKIGRTVQISDSGIVPGSSAKDGRREISRVTMGVPVAAVGVPTVAELSSVTGRAEHNGYLVTAGNEDAEVRVWSQVIAAAINAL